MQQRVFERKAYMDELASQFMPQTRPPFTSRWHCCLAQSLAWKEAGVPEIRKPVSVLQAFELFP
jgi:hypothetical protein